MTTKTPDKQEQYIKERVTDLVLDQKNITSSIEKDNSHNMRKYMSRDYINECLSKMPSGQNRVLCVFLWKTGVRISEAINVRKQDIDFENYIIKIKWLKNRKYKERHLPMHPSLFDILHYYVSSLNLADKLFPISRQRAERITKRWFKYSPHAFRHSFAVNWLRCDGDLIILSRYLGHARIKETMEYLKIVPIDQGKELIKIQF